MRGRTGAGFTLVEILIVVLILSILAVIVLPSFNIHGDALRSTMDTQLRTLRHQIELYKQKHVGQPPALVLSNDGAVAWAALTGSDPPYLYDPPINPFTGQSGIDDAPSVAIGWVWDEATATITGPYYDEQTGEYSPP